MKQLHNKAIRGECLVSKAPITLRLALPSGLSRITFLRELIKIYLRALLHLRQTTGWLQLLNSDPVFLQYVQVCPRFLYKVYRPYISTTMKADQRLEIIREHYKFIFARGLSQVVGNASIAAEPLAEIESRNGLVYQIRLRTMNEFDREGELVLQLAQENNVLCSIVFTIAPRYGRSAVSIGCLQGGKSDNALEAIRLATRELHGMRPKHLLVSLVRQLGHKFGCELMLLVSNGNRVVYTAIRNGRVIADYDQLWEELGAHKRPDGDYEMNCTQLPLPHFDTIPSKKRSEARRRFTMLVHLVDAVAIRLHAPRLTNNSF
jgi:uncharacterized protein VirK/YbjX